MCPASSEMLLFSFLNHVKAVVDNVNIKVIAVFQYGCSPFTSVILSHTVMVLSYWRPNKSKLKL